MVDVVRTSEDSSVYIMKYNYVYYINNVDLQSAVLRNDAKIECTNSLAAEGYEFTIESLNLSCRNSSVDGEGLPDFTVCTVAGTSYRETPELVENFNDYYSCSGAHSPCAVYCMNYIEL